MNKCTYVETGCGDCDWTALLAERDQLCDHIDKMEREWRWVSVTDGLPNDLEKVICTYFGADDEWVSTGYRRDGEWYDYADCECTIGVTHWMPMPKPPKVGQL